jgi:hypothetical protein
LAIREEDGGEARRTWAAVPKVDETARHILLFDVLHRRRALSAHVIPRRAFATAEEAEIFLAAARHWQAVAHGGPTPADASPLSAADGVTVRLPEMGPDAEAPCSVTFTMTDDDRRRAHRFYLAQQPAQGRTLIGLTLLLVLWGLYSGHLVRLGAISGAGRTFLLLPLLFLLASVGLSWWNRRYRRPEPEEAEAGAMTVTIAPVGYAIARAGETQATRTWRGARGFGSTAEFLVIPRVVLGEREVIAEAYLIPRRAFATPAAADEFLAAARRWHAAAQGPDDV